MKIKDMPEWALKYKTKGHTIRQIGDNRFGLYRATSQYVKGKNPKTILTFVGVITEQDGLIPKKVKPTTENSYREYGLSHFIYTYFKRELQRSLYNGRNNDDFIRLAIIKYVFGHISAVLIRSTYISNGIEEKLIDFSTKFNPKRIQNLCNKIDQLFHSLIKDENDFITLIALLKLVVVSNKNSSAYFPEEIISILRKYGVNHEKMQ